MARQARGQRLAGSLGEMLGLSLRSVRDQSDRHARARSRAPRRDEIPVLRGGYRDRRTRCVLQAVTAQTK
jgi:hypothetical protein